MIARKKLLFLAAAVLFLLAQSVQAISVRSDEQAEARRWAAAKFEGKVEPKLRTGYLEVLDKEGAVLKNGTRDGPLRIAKESYSRGLYTGGINKLAVHLPSPGRSFEAIAGLEANGSACGYSGGSAIFSVGVGGSEAFRSGEVRIGAAGIPVRIAMEGATEFVLETSGPSASGWCPDGAWADARVTLSDGQTLWLDELPVAPVRAPYAAEPQFSFVYGGKGSSELLKNWAVERQTRRLDEQRTEYTLTYKDPQTGLVLRSVGVEYHDYPAVEWTLYFENDGAVDTPILENIQAVDMPLERNGDGEFILHHSKGSPYSPTDYEPFETTLGAKETKRITAAGGRPTNSDLCYFNVEWPGEGVIVALGWPGQWAAEFKRDAGRSLQVTAGQELTHFTLHPGEKVRTPLIALLFWKGDWIRAQNIWRRWMLAHNLPREGGKPLRPAILTSSAPWTDEMSTADEASQILFMRRYLEEGIKPEYWEMDAGWYVSDGHWWNTGTWEPDPKRFPHGLRPIYEYAHANGIKTHVWFEVERVTKGSWLWDNHPEWLLKLPDGGEDGQRLLNLGDPQAYQWVVETLDKYISQGIDFYRTDFNIDPLPYWRANDSNDRQGITEIKYATGFLAYFDELLRRHPNLLIDTCASGGRRNDLETLRRGLPITRTDYAFDTPAQQSITHGIAFWIPFYGTGSISTDPWALRSIWGPHPGFGWDVRRKDLDYGFLRHMLAEWRSIGDNYFGDYYPLTPYNSTNSVWMAWQFDRSDLGTGILQVFRRSESPYETARFHLRSLEPEGRYDVSNLDVSGTTQKTGRQLMEDGLSVTLNDSPRAAIITYRRVNASR